MLAHKVCKAFLHEEGDDFLYFKAFVSPKSKTCVSRRAPYAQFLLIGQKLHTDLRSAPLTPTRGSVVALRYVPNLFNFKTNLSPYRLSQELYFRSLLHFKYTFI